MTSKVGAKVVLLGKSNVGKTCLWHRYLRDRFPKDYQCTLGAPFGSRQEEIDGNIVELQIWDTAGGEQYEAICNLYYRKAIAAIICYDLTDDNSYDKAKFWVRELREHEKDCEIFLCGTKLDLIKKDRQKRKVDYDSVKYYANEINAQVFETSSQTAENVGLVSLRMEEPKKRKRCRCR